MLESGIPEWFTSLGPRENLVLCWKTGLCWTGNGLVEQEPLPSSPFPLAWGLASPVTPLPAQPPCPAPSLMSETAPGTVHKLQSSEVTGWPPFEKKYFGWV